LSRGFDQNGDGLHEFYAGVPMVGAGSAMLFTGDGAKATTKQPAIGQERVASTIPIVAGSKSDSTTGYHVHARKIGTPAGRMLVQLQVESKPYGTAFDGTGLVTSPAVDSTTAAGITQSISGTTGQKLHWRARFKYDQNRGHAFHHSRWIYGGLPGHPGGVHVRLP
jgi:hypothetical protein